MHAAFRISMKSFKSESMPTDQFVSWRNENEWNNRTNRNQIMRLSDKTFVTEPRNLFIIDSAGTGKSFIATALGYMACQKGIRALYANTAHQIGQLRPQKPKAPY